MISNGHQIISHGFHQLKLKILFRFQGYETWCPSGNHRHRAPAGILAGDGDARNNRGYPGKTTDSLIIHDGHRGIF